MTRFRCELVDDIGAPSTRIVEARTRDQAVLLLLAEGATPVSVARDAPSLADRFARPGTADDADGLIQDMARMVAAGLPITQAAALLDGERAARIASGELVGEVLAGIDTVPAWIPTALTLATVRGNADRALVAVAADVAAIAERRNIARALLVEAAAVIALTLLVIATRSPVGMVIAAAGALALLAAVRAPNLIVARAMADLRIADFLHVVGRLIAEGGALPDSVRLAAADTIDPRERSRIDAAFLTATSEADLLSRLARALGLSAVDEAILVRGDAAMAARDIATHCATAALAHLRRAALIVRIAALAVVAVILVNMAA